MKSVWTSGGLDLFPLGLGCMGMSGMYGRTDRAECVSVIRAAIDSGVTLLDTGDFYGMGHNEMLIAEALRPGDRDRVVLSVKFGALRGPAGDWVGYDARPAAVKSFLAYSLQRLKTDYIDIYRPARLDPQTPIEDTIGALADLVKAGYIRRIGLSEVGSDTLKRACAVHPICDLQIEYSLFSRGVEADILPTCRDLGVGITAYGVLARGPIGGAPASGGPLDPTDTRRGVPRFHADNLRTNLQLVANLEAAAAPYQLTAAQAAVAWVRSRGADILPVVGARTQAQLASALEAIRAEPPPEAIAAISAAAPDQLVAGARYPERAMRDLDSEKRSTSTPPRATVSPETD